MNVACSICLESFTLTSDIYTTPCGHVFYYECIQKWLERGNPHCSLCRQNCEINEITRLHFSENEAALEENYAYTQLESENLKLQKEVNESKARELEANKKCTQLKENHQKLFETFCQFRSDSAGRDRVLKEQRKEIDIKDKKISELEAKCNQFEEFRMDMVNCHDSIKGKIKKFSNDTSDSWNKTKNSEQPTASTTQASQPTSSLGKPVNMGANKTPYGNGMLPFFSKPSTSATSQENIIRPTFTGGINKPFKVSVDLKAIIGLSEASRHQCIKLLWAYLKQNNLQNPVNKSFFTPDRKMAKVFGKDSIKAFSMSKYLGNHLSPLDK